MTASLSIGMTVSTSFAAVVLAILFHSRIRGNGTGASFTGTFEFGGSRHGDDDLINVVATFRITHEQIFMFFLRRSSSLTNGLPKSV
jgi:hypothetical protein